MYFLYSILSNWFKDRYVFIKYYNNNTLKFCNKKISKIQIKSWFDHISYRLYFIIINFCFLKILLNNIKLIRELQLFSVEFNEYVKVVMDNDNVTCAFISIIFSFFIYLARVICNCFLGVHNYVHGKIRLINLFISFTYLNILIKWSIVIVKRSLLFVIIIKVLLYLINNKNKKHACNILLQFDNN